MAGGRGHLEHIAPVSSVIAMKVIFMCRQDARLTELWEQYGGQPGHLDRIAS
jgi:hypothetical protein